MAMAEPEPPEPVEEVSPSAGPVDAAEPEPEPRDASASRISERPASPEPAAVSITGIPVCDEYLALYERCEEHLRPQIMAGERRFYRAEVASLQYFVGTPEVAKLPASCRSMLDALLIDCPEQHRRPPAPSSSSARGGASP